MKVAAEKCVGCGQCVLDCPVDAVRLVKKKAHIGESCVNCGACLKVCQENAVLPSDDTLDTSITCEACPIQCQIKEGYTGACKRFIHRKGNLERTISVKTYEQVKDFVGPDWNPAIRRPLITGIGAGTTYPDCKPAPFIVQNKKDDIDVVTVVTEAPLSYSGLKVKVDTDRNIGEERATVLYQKKPVGHLTTEEYGSKILSIGGVNLLTGENGITVARFICAIANRKRVTVKIRGGGRLELQVGEKPVIDGVEDTVMRVGCGSATLGLFAHLFKECADEVVVLDSHLTGLLSEHAAGVYVGAQPSGVQLRFSRSTPGRYFGDRGHGWGGTSITDPQEIIQSIDMAVARPGMQILITETTGRKASMFQVNTDGSLKNIALSEKSQRAMAELANSCQQARVSALYTGGSGGSARAGVVRYPIKLTQAVHEMKARLTVGGAPAFILPGGGINFLVNVEQVMPGAFSWIPTPATVCPIEYTMTLHDYETIGGHTHAMKPFDAWER